MKNNQIKILLLSPWSGDIDDERKLRHYYLIKELINHDIYVDLVAEGVNNKKFRRFMSVTKNSIYYAPNIKTGQTKYTKMMTRILNMAIYIFYALFISVRERKHYDKVWVSIPHIGPSVIGILLNKFFNKELIYEIRDPWPKLLVDLNIIQKESMIAKILQFLDTSMLKRSKYIISPNYNIDYLSEEFKKKTIIFPNAVAKEVLDSISYTNKKNNGYMNMIYAGGAANSYQMDVILKAIAIARKDIDKIRLNLYIDNREIERFFPLAKELEITDIVNFYEKIDQNKLFENIIKNDYYIFHLKDLEMFRPGISSNKLMDPLICGRPVIMGAMIENNWVKEAKAGVVVKPENPSILAEAIISAYNKRQTNEYNQMCKNAYNFAREKLSLSRKIKELSDFGIFS